MAQTWFGTVTGPLRVAVACSGLGHVQRGIEAWASDLANGLNKAGVLVSLFGGAPADGAIHLQCLRRTTDCAGVLARLLQHAGGWRYGAGSPYELEQASFSLALWHRIRSGFDILHVQDPLIATWFETAHRRGVSKPRVVYANGTGENADVMRQFRSLQLLTGQASDLWHGHEPAGQSVFTIPNFVDTKVFAPGNRKQARALFDLPLDKVVVLCCAAIRRTHKRIDHLLA